MECLDEQGRLRPDGDLTGLTRRFQKRLATANVVPWMLATNEDYRYRETEGPKPGWTTRGMHRYLDQVIRLTTRDARPRQALLEVFHMLQPPAALFRPAILLPALREMIGRREASTTRNDGSPALPAPTSSQ